MVGAKGNCDALTFISSPKIDNELSTLTKSTTSSPTKANLYEILIVSESGNKVDNIMEEENNEEDAMEEKEEKNVEDAMADEEAENDKSKEHSKEKVDANSNEKVRKPRKRNRRKKVTQGVADKVVSKDEDKPESKVKKQASKKVASMGMIFMCSSKTKKDCYLYKVLGLPASKKDIVQKIYKGMRLFLFDFDLRLMYGIYKAAGPGGSNIEPKAFKSAFPSQVLIMTPV